MDIDKSKLENRLELSLFLLRFGVFIVMAAWAMDKILNPGHAIMIFEELYYIRGLGDTMMTGIGVIELLIILAFLGGLWKPYTYGFVIVVHAISAIAPWKKYTVELGATYSQLYFADWPMLAVCITLYVLRDLDVRFTLGGKKSMSI